MLRIGTLHTCKHVLCLTIEPIDVFATRACLASVGRSNRKASTAIPGKFVFQLPAELKPPLIKDTLIQRTFGFSSGGLVHLANGQVFHNDQCVGFAECGRFFVEEIFPRIGNTCVQALQLGFLLFSIVTMFDFTAERLLGLFQPLFVLCEAV